MLTDEEILPTVYYWASKFKSDRFEYRELLAVGYLAAKEINNVLLLQKTVKYSMLKFMIGDKNVQKNLDYDEQILDSKTVRQKYVDELMEDVTAAIKAAKFTDKTLNVLNLFFYHNMTSTDIAKYLGNVTQQAVNLRLQKALERLRCIIKSRHSDFRKEMLCQE